MPGSESEEDALCNLAPEYNAHVLDLPGCCVNVEAVDTTEKGAAHFGANNVSGSTDEDVCGAERSTITHVWQSHVTASQSNQGPEPSMSGGYVCLVTFGRRGVGLSRSILSLVLVGIDSTNIWWSWLLLLCSRGRLGVTSLLCLLLAPTCLLVAELLCHFLCQLHRCC